MKSLKQKCMSLEYRKSVIFFKVTDAIVELGGPPLIWDSTLISPDQLEVEVSKLMDKWVGEFDNMSYFSKYNIRTWTVDYVNLNNNIFVTICESYDDLIEIEKYFFEMKIKQVIIVSPLWAFIYDWLEKQLATIVKTA